MTITAIWLLTILVVFIAIFLVVLGIAKGVDLIDSRDWFEPFLLFVVVLGLVWAGYWAAHSETRLVLGGTQKGAK